MKKYKLNMPKVAAYMGKETLTYEEFCAMGEYVKANAEYKAPATNEGATLYLAPTPYGYMAMAMYENKHQNPNFNNGVTLFGVTFPQTQEKANEAQYLRYANNKGAVKV